MATAGRMPTTTVRASRMRDIRDKFPIMRPMNESTMSSDRDVDEHLRAALMYLGRQIIL